MRQAVEVDPGADVLFELALQVASSLTFEQGQPVVSRGGRVCLLGWVNSATERYRNAHQCGTNDHHNQACGPRPKPRITSEKEPAQKQHCDCECVGRAQRPYGVLDEKK